jgi:hypothetical protein
VRHKFQFDQSSFLVTFWSPVSSDVVGLLSEAFFSSVRDLTLETSVGVKESVELVLSTVTIW